MLRKETMMRSLLALVLIFTLVFPSLALADTDEVLTRLAGFDRYETAAEIAKAGWRQSDYAILAPGWNFPDALAATPLARKYDAPILLTVTDRLTEVTKQTLLDLQVKNVIIVGGTAVVSASVFAELQTMGLNVRRVYGFDKYETAVEIARELGSPSEVFVVTGDDFFDALTVASAAGVKQIPILLVGRNSVPDSVSSYVDSQNINRSYVIGDFNTISSRVFNQFPNGERIFGVTKYRTNLAVNMRFISADVFQSNSVCLASGEVFADALTGSAYAAKISAPVLLVNNNLGTVTNEYANYRAESGSNFFVFGGTAVIPERLTEQLILSAKPPEERYNLDVENFRAEVLRLTNIERAMEGLRPLTRGPAALEQAADVRAAEAIVRWSHTRPSGENCFTVLAEFGITSYYMAGENLYMSSIGTPEDAIISWMESPSHKDAILTPGFTQLGVGVAIDNNGIIYASQLFLQEW